MVWAFDGIEIAHPELETAGGVFSSVRLAERALIGLVVRFRPSTPWRSLSWSLRQRVELSLACDLLNEHL